MPFVRSGGSGVLARYVQNSGTIPFNVADWTPQTNIDLSIDGGTGSLVMKYHTPLVDTGWRFVRPTAIASRAQTLIHGVVRANVTKLTSVGLCQYWDGLPFVMGAFSATAKRVAVVGSASDIQAFHPYGGITTTIASDGAAPPRTSGTQYRMTVWADGVNIRAHDFDTGWEGGGALVGLAAGYPGLATTHDTTDNVNSYSACDSFFACVGRYLVVSNVPVGYTVKLVRSDLAVLATAVADIAGVATLDCIAVSLPDPHFLALYTPAAVLVEQSQPLDISGTLTDGIWPGENYTYDPTGIRSIIAPSSLTLVDGILG